MSAVNYQDVALQENLTSAVHHQDVALEVPEGDLDLDIHETSLYRCVLKS